MNPLRKLVHRTMELSGLDRKIDPNAINRRLEMRAARHFPISSAADANSWILEVIRAGKPAALGKLGSSECWTLAWHLQLKRFYKYTWAAPAFGELDLAEQSGVFPNDEQTFRRFCEIYLERLRVFDGLAVWHNAGESGILSRYCPHARRFHIQALEPYFFSPPWSSALTGKRVLVVHPFEKSIKQQFDRRSQLWPAQSGILPDFELEFVKSPYGFSKTNFADWPEMNRWLESQVEACFRKKPFDVALIGCGAAGVPLAGFVKQLGAVGIHTGGPTQLLFGIRGRRWDRMPNFQQFLNAAWIRPTDEETPGEARKVDSGGGYW
ncbi:MAG TPA: hypothetical protein VIS99_06775 [Terrimicrobiaceae bacterium]